MAEEAFEMLPSLLPSLALWSPSWLLRTRLRESQPRKAPPERRKIGETTAAGVLFIDLNFPLPVSLSRVSQQFLTCAALLFNDSNINLTSLPTPSHSQLDLLFVFVFALWERSRGRTSLSHALLRSPPAGASLKTSHPPLLASTVTTDSTVYFLT